MLALVLDVGLLYAEREDLQSGADAAVMAVAVACARSTPGEPCTMSDATSLAQTYANANAGDGISDVLEVCGSVLIGGDIQNGCSAPVGNLTDCLPPVDTSINQYVEVRLGTETSGGDSVLPPVFAQTLLGNGSYSGTSVRACARATWGPPVSATAAAFTVSTCDFNTATNFGDGYAPMPPGDASSFETVLHLHGTTSAASCTSGTPGWDDPAGFGWLNEDSACAASVTESDSVAGNAEESPSADCVNQLGDWRSDGTVLLVPVHDGTLDPDGSEVDYHVVGFAAFVVTGYFLPGAEAASILTGSNPCSDTDRCLYGYFTHALLPVSGTINAGSPDFGATIVTLIG
jgi:hypothetical protein